MALQAWQTAFTARTTSCQPRDSSGFGSFGSKDQPRISYFDNVIHAIEAALGTSLEGRCAVHEPPPTGPLERRVDSLYQQVDEVLTHGFRGGKDAIRRVHIVGHSTGGLDARLLLNRFYRWYAGPSAAEREKLTSRVATVVTVSAPMHGTPLARRIRWA